MEVAQLPSKALSVRKQEIRRWSDASASERALWRRRAAFFHSEDLRYIKFFPKACASLNLAAAPESFWQSSNPPSVSVLI